MKKKYIVLFTLFAANLIDQPAPDVKIEQGLLRGVLSSDGTFYEYLNIPYATANSTNRFKDPLPPPSWEGIYQAVGPQVQCMQNTPFRLIGQEDCLKLHIYVPASSKGPFPVMFHIHGGAFTLGSGGKLIYGPDFLVKKDVIMVSINYRLGALGFMCLGIEEAPGNAGLKDQVAALKWVKGNIAAFGGDPDNITIFGESAGGVSVSLLVVSNTTKGLFHKAIAQSGSSLSNWALSHEPIKAANILLKDLGYDATDPHQIYNILSNISVKDFMSFNLKKRYDLFFEPKFIFLPCIEKILPGIEPFLTDLPYNILKNKKVEVSLLSGSTSREGLFLIAEDSDEDLNAMNNVFLTALDLQFQTLDDAKRVSDKVKEFYFGVEKINKNNILNVSEFYTDLYFEAPAIMEYEHLIKYSNISIFNYYFDYSGKRNFLKERSGYKNEPGACHADELLYLFKGLIWPFWISKADQIMIDWMTEMWTNFAKYGHPTPDWSDIPVKWVPSDKYGLKFLYITDVLAMGPIPDPESYDLWKNIYANYRRTSVGSPNIFNMNSINNH